MVTKTPKLKMGRPPLPASKKRLPSVGFRPTPEIRKKLAKAADSSDRSLSQEIESRLERSFLSESIQYEEFGGEQLYWLMKAVAASGRLILEREGGDFNDPNTQVKVVSIMELVLQSVERMPTTGRTKRLGTGEFAKGWHRLMETALLKERDSKQKPQNTAKKKPKKPKKTKKAKKASK